MHHQVISLPDSIIETIARLVSVPEHRELVKHAEQLHSSYTQHYGKKADPFIRDRTDALSYLALRAPATYAQVYGALSQIQALIPSWHPRSLLDIGSGPGSGLWACRTLFPILESVTCLDQDTQFLTLGEEIIPSDSTCSISWQKHNLRSGLPETLTQKYDLVIIANVLNELSPLDRKRLLTHAHNLCQGVLLVLEPGTPSGFEIIQTTAQKISPRSSLLAPYINNSFVSSQGFWLHFSQRFIRPKFQRQLRQNMRDSSLMASDWEEAKYSYVAFSDIEPEQSVWGRCVGNTVKQKGFLELPVLTQKEITVLKVMKRYKHEYEQAKKMAWGDVIAEHSLLLQQG